MSHNPPKTRQMTKAPPRIVKFFSKPLSPSNEQSSPTSPTPTSPTPPTSLNDRKRKFTAQESSQNEDPSTYAKTLQKKAAKISKIQRTKKVGSLVSEFFQQGNSDDLSDFESPHKKMQFKAPPVIPKKKVTRKRKLPAKQSKNKNALESDIFEKVLVHHSNADGLNSDDLQMALALSRSLADSHGTTGESSDMASMIRNAEPSTKEDIVKQTLQKFGFKKRDKNDYDYRDFFTNFGPKRKWTSKFTPLTRRSENMQREKFKKKVKNILLISENLQNIDAQAVQEYDVTSSYLQQLLAPRSPSYNISLAAMETTTKSFYVNDLVPISTLRCGCLLRNWADIPGRDVSPERFTAVPSNVDDTKDSVETHTTSGTVERNCEEINDALKSDVDHILEPKSIVDPNENPETLDVDRSSESSKYQENEDYFQDIHSDSVTDIERKCNERPTTQVEPKCDEHVTNDVEQKSDECRVPNLLNVDAITNLRIPSPDMFADFNSANNSLNDSDLLEESTNNAANADVVDSPNILINLHSPSSDNLGCEHGSFNSQIDKNDEIGESEEIIEAKSPSSIVAEDHIVLSSDDSNQGCVKDSEPSSETQQQKFPSIPLISTFVKRLSFTERLELYNSDPALENVNGDLISSIIHHSSQDSIVISDDEINYSLNHCPEDEKRSIDIPTQESIELSDSEDDQIVSQLTKEKSVVIPTQESIELSDSEDDQIVSQLMKEKSVVIPAQESIELSSEELPKDDIKERQSFFSMDDNYFAGIDINIDDELFNSNHSLNDEDLINDSIHEMCQKEFVSGLARPSSSKSFLRTTSDISFERTVWKPPKTPDKFDNLSDDELDEFDKMVRGYRSQTENQLPNPTENSIEISDDLSGSESPALPTQSNEFIVTAMNQMYEVRTGVLVSPKPDFENMDSPTRLKHLKKYGLKTLSKRKAVICLEHVYNRLHPFVELDKHEDLDNILTQNEMHANDFDKKIDDIAVSIDDCQPLADNHFDILQENEEVFYLPSAPRAKKPWCLQPLHVAWHNLIKSNAALHDHILQYKPIDILEIRLLFKSIGLLYETNDIISFLDRKCITFKTENKRNNAVKKN